MYSDFQIPHKIRNKLIPDPTLSIHALLHHTFPPFNSSNIGQGLESAFFNSSDPDQIDDEVIARLQHLPIPSPKCIQELVLLRSDAVEAGFQSITYKHLDLEAILGQSSESNYPLWVITFWEEAVRIKGIVSEWLKCRDWLTVHLGQRKHSERQSMAEKASIILASLPWGQNKPHGLADTLPIHGLWRYLGSNYLSCSEIEDALKFMHTDLFYDATKAMSTQIEGTPFVMFLFDAYRNRQTYGDVHHYAWLRKVGETLAVSNGRLATITSLEPITGDQHWVALYISEGGKKVEYGDSLHQGIPSLLWEVVTWWIRYHDSSVHPFLSNLPTILQTDGHSCGVLAVEALHGAFALPCECTDRNPATLRLKLFNRVSKEIVMRLPQASHASSSSATNDEIIGNAIPESKQVKAKHKPVKKTLTDFWSIETGEEKQLRRLREAEQLSERCEGEEEKKRRQKLEKQAQRTRDVCEAQQRYRKRKRDEIMEEKLDESSVSHVGDIAIIPRIDSPTTTLICSDANKLPTSTFFHSTVAEISRPRRQFRVELRKQYKPVGPKSVRKQEIACRTNWFMPLIWSSIEQAALRAGKPWSPRSITKEAKLLNPELFKNLREQVVGRWIDKESQARGESRWSDSVIWNVKRNSPGGTITRFGILAPYPAVQQLISSQLKSLREAGVALTVITIRAVMIAIINDMAPEINEIRAKDGSQFKCSETFVRKYLHKTLNWSERCATKAAQKLPSNYEEILRNAFLREAFIIRDYSIPAALRVNTDQTQLVYQQGSNKTWNIKGVKQVATIGQEEKRAFTLIPSISASGELLPMQAIYMGKTNTSCPSPGASGYNLALDLSFQMLPSMTSTYWSTQETMKILVNTIISPYFERKKEELGLPPSQHSIWKIDCWSVHRSESFRQWMKENHGNIILVYVPGGCTSIWQPLDVGIQRVLKLSMRRASHRDIVNEVSKQIDDGVDQISIDTTLGTLRNRSVQWVVKAINDINNKQLILKAFKMCHVSPDWNLSQESLTSISALEALRNLPRTNKELYDELSGLSHPTTPEVQSQVEEPPFTECPDDHSDVPLSMLIHALTGEQPEGVFMADDGSLGCDSMAESENMEIQEILPLQEKRPTRMRKPPVPFGGHELWYEH